MPLVPVLVLSRIFDILNRPRRTLDVTDLALYALLCPATYWCSWRRREARNVDLS
jgi:hypothetical protein